MGLKESVKSKMDEIKLKKNVSNTVKDTITRSKDHKFYQQDVTDKNGSNTRYYNKRDIKNAVKHEVNNKLNQEENGVDNDQVIQKLKSQLEDEVSHYGKIMKELTNPGRVGEVGTQAKGRKNDIKVTKVKINKLTESLVKQGVKINIPKIWSEFKVMYEGGYDIMDRNDIKSMRLDVYEDAAAGKITEGLKDYLLTYLEYVDLRLQQGEAYTEAVNNIIEQKRSDFIEFVERSYDSGSIDKRQYEVMIEMSGEDFMFETPTPDDIPGLVIEYLEAAKEGDEDAKASIKEKLDTAKELDEIAKNSEDEVTESACESLKDKLEELKIKLTDDEKKVVEKLDEKMKKAMGDCDENSEGSDDSGEEPEEDEEKDDNKSSKDDKGESNVEESVEEPVVGFSSNSGLTDEEKKEMIKYVKEAADEGVYTEEDLNRIIEMLK